jgi:hypothetical protein
LVRNLNRQGDNELGQAILAVYPYLENNQIPRFALMQSYLHFDRMQGAENSAQRAGDLIPILEARLRTGQNLLQRLNEAIETADPDYGLEQYAGFNVPSAPLSPVQPDLEMAHRHSNPARVRDDSSEESHSEEEKYPDE